MPLPFYIIRGVLVDNVFLVDGLEDIRPDCDVHVSLHELKH